MNIFSQNDYERFSKLFITQVPVSAAVGNSCKKFIAKVEEAEKKKMMIKKIKDEVCLYDDGSKKEKDLWILKVIKLFYITLTPSDFINEDSYLYFVLSPILKNLLNSDGIYLLFGECNLKAKAIEVNRYLDDDERRFAGPKIDVIIKNTKYNLEVMIVEVSGPPHKVNQTHFLEDRKKIGKNLKSMFKYIVSKMEVPSVTLIKKLRLYGIQFYNNDVYVYSISKPCDYCYVFAQHIKYSIPGDICLLNQSLPTFSKNLYGIKYLMEETEVMLDKLFKIDVTQDILEENNDDPSPHISPKKKQKEKADY